MDGEIFLHNTTRTLSILPLNFIPITIPLTATGREVELYNLHTRHGDRTNNQSPAHGDSRVDGEIFPQINNPKKNPSHETFLNIPPKKCLKNKHFLKFKWGRISPVSSRVWNKFHTRRRVGGEAEGQRILNLASDPPSIQEIPKLEGISWVLVRRRF